MKRIYKFFLMSFIMVFAPMMKLHAINWPIIEKTVNNGQTFRLDCSEHWSGSGSFGPIDFYTVNGKGKSQTDFKVDIHYYNSGSRCYYNFTALNRGTFKVGIEVAFENLWYNGQSHSGTDMVYYNIHVLDVVSVELPSYLDLNVGETSKLNVRVTDSDANYSLKWESTNENVATVDNNGNVKGLREGKATITCTANNGVYGSCEVTVSSIKVTNIILSTQNLTLKYGENKQLSATIIPTNASNKNVTWSSNNPSVASVNSAGLVTGVNNGTTIITCTSNDGSGVKATCNVSVQDSDPLPVGSAFVENSIAYRVIGDGTVSVNNGRSSKGVVSIPETVRHSGCNYSVKEIENQAFSSNSSLTSVTIPNSVTFIDIYAFYGCSNLKSVSFGNSVTSIGEQAFYGCSSLTSVTIPNSVTEIGYGIFQNCSGLTSVTIPRSVTCIGRSAFQGCSGLKSVAIPNSVTTIGYSAFESCSSLTSVTIPNSVTSINSEAFRDCSSLMSMTIPNSVTSIGASAFNGCSGLTSVTIPNSVTSIGGGAFSGCSKLSLYVDCKTIEEKSFKGSGIKELIIGNSVTLIYPSAFEGCKSLTSVTIGNGITCIYDGVFKDCTSLKSVTIPNSVTSIEYYPFSGCTGLTSVHITDLEAWCKISFLYNGSNPLTYAHHLYLNGTEIKDLVIPNTVTTIGASAFSGCRGLTSVTIPNSVTSIGGYAFNNCSGLTSVTIPNSVTKIGGYAFRECSGLTSVTIPNSVTSIGGSAFDGTAWYNNKHDGMVYAGKVAYRYKGEMPANTAIKIKDGTLGIAGGTFSGCSSLTSVTIPNSVTSIGGSAFKDCTGLTSVHITNLEAWCKISFSDSNPLAYAHHLYLNGTEIKDLVIPNTVTTIGGYTFYGCSGLTSVTIPNSVTSIGGYTFYGCSGLTSVTIPNSVTSIGGFAFDGCSGLTSVTIPNSVTKISDGAFWGCSALMDLYCYAKEVPTQYRSFETETISNVTLHVPSGSVDAYKAKAPWNGFKEIVEIVAKIKLNKSKATIEKGKTLTLKPTFTPTSFPDKSVTWKSSNTKVATVTSKGKVKAVKAGTATITCTSVATGTKATCKVTVGYVKLDKTEAIVKKGKTITLTPTVYPSSLSDKSVTWKSSNTKVATVTNEGKVKGVKAGTVTVTCTSVATGLSTTCEVTVGYVKLDKTEAIVKKGKTITLTPTVYPSSLSDKSVTWKSSNTKVATVTSAGKVKGVKAGTATITCTSVATGLSTTCAVTVGYVKLDKSEVSVEKGKTVTLKATVYPSSLEDKSVTWESSNTKVATVTNSGKVKGIKAGTAAITCTSIATGFSTTCIVTVINGSVTLNKSEVALIKGKTITLKATVNPTTLADKSVTWESADTKVATVTSAGKVKAVKEGTTVITCTSNATGAKATCKVIVGKVVINMPEITLRKNGTVTLTATVYPSSLTDKSVTWESSDTKIATVTSEGKVKGIKAGTATITCTSVATGLSGTCTVTVLSTSGGRSLEGDDDTTGIETIEEAPAPAEPYDVYDLSGRKVRHQVNSLDGLPDGVYIVNGKKILKKK